MKTEKFQKFPLTVTEGGVSAKVRKVVQIKKGRAYTVFIADYTILGSRKQVGRAKFDDAKKIALDACRLIASGQQASLTITDGERHSYLRANEVLKPLGIGIDLAANEYAGALQILGGKASIAEACRDWSKRNATELPRVKVSDAVKEIIHQAKINRRSTVRVRQLSSILGRFARDFNTDLQTITPLLISHYLSGLPLSERSKRNYSDTLGFFNRFCMLRGYVHKGTDWLEGVQKYSARKIGTIEIYTPDEMTVLLKKADRRFIPFLVIGAFAGLRHSEICRLDWRQIELSDNPNDSFIEVLPVENTKSDQRRRLVPVHDNLKAWLRSVHKHTGKVCPVEDIAKQLLKTAAKAEIAWKHNALRHSFISYRAAECSDVPRTADEAGNSVQVIRTNYLRRVKPALAAEWFSIQPQTTGEQI